MGASLPFAYDDPSNSEAKFKQMIIEAFGGASVVHARQQMTARCVPLITANEFIIHKLTANEPRYLSRCLLLPCVTNSPDVELDVLNGILDKAVAALPHALRVGKAVLEMEADDIYHIRDRIQELCTVKLTDSRLTTHYAIITACALQIIDEVPNARVSKEDVWEYLQEALLPEVANRQVQHTKLTTLENMLGVIADLVDYKHATLSLPKVLTVVNPRVRFAPRRGMPLMKGVAVSLKLFLKLLEKHGIEHPEEKVIRQQLSPRQDVTTRSKSFFLKQNVHLTRIDRGVAAGGSTVPLTCVCVSQHCIPQNTLDILMVLKCTLLLLMIMMKRIQEVIVKMRMIPCQGDAREV